jgi:hypothetical protein
VERRWRFAQPGAKCMNHVLRARSISFAKQFAAVGDEFVSRPSCSSSFIAFSAFIALTLTPVSAFAQHGGGGGHSGGGGFHGGGGGFHGSAGGVHGGGGYSRGGAEGVHGGGFGGGARSAGAGSYGRGGMSAGRNLASMASHSSLPSAINDGQWHSFGGSGASARSGLGRSENAAGSNASSTLLARNSVGAGNGWRSFGSATSHRAAGGEHVGIDHVGLGSHWGSGWGGYGWHGYGWGPAWGFGWGWGLGFGWPYWGIYWGSGWNPWWYGPYAYNPYWYAPLNYPYDPGYSLNWEDNPPPYRLDASGDNAASNNSFSPNLNASVSAVDAP